MQITHKYPEGYVEEESEYCREEENALFNCTEAPFHPDRIKARNRLLSKREEFRRKYYRRK